MARNAQPGTPDRSPRYIFPAGTRRSLRFAAIGAAVLAAIIGIAYAAGLKRVSSPGPVASSHSPIETRCEQCHTVGHGVADVRCERCHDPGGADRFTQQGHVLFGSGNNDTLTGNGGADTFLFQLNGGHGGNDTVTDFSHAQGDKLDISAYGLSSADLTTLLQNAPSDSVTFTNGDTLTLTNVQVASLNQNDFILHH